MLVFLSWDWSFCHGFISLSLCIVCVCVASCYLCLPKFHAFLGLCPSPSILLLIHPIIYQIIYPLAVLTYPSHLSLSVFISHLCPSIRSSISIWLFCWKHRHFFVAFYQEDHRNQGHKNQKVKMTRTQSFFFITFKWEGIFKIDLVTYSMMFIRSFLVYCILGNIVSINILLEISHQEID